MWSLEEEGRGRGYDYKENMSNNAKTAYEEGLRPAHKWKLEGDELLSLVFKNSRELQNFLRNYGGDECHHTGKNYKLTHFYSMDHIIRLIFDDIDKQVCYQTVIGKTGRGYRDRIAVVNVFAPHENRSIVLDLVKNQKNDDWRTTLEGFRAFALEYNSRVPQRHRFQVKTLEGSVKVNNLQMEM